MELKFVFNGKLNPVFDTFNRTAYGIEIHVRFPSCGDKNLLIAPLMELKLLIVPFPTNLKNSFNRTAYGIEMK